MRAVRWGELKSELVILHGYVRAKPTSELVVLCPRATAGEVRIVCGNRRRRRPMSARHPAARLAAEGAPLPAPECAVRVRARLHAARRRGGRVCRRRVERAGAALRQ